MATNFPTSVDDASTVGDDSHPSADELLSSTDGGPAHHALHQNVGLAINAIEDKVGTGASTPATNSVLAGTGSGTSAWSTAPTLDGLTVDGDVTFQDATPVFTLKDTNTTGGSNFQIKFTDDADTTLSRIYGGAGNDMRFEVNGNDVLFLRDNGNVGIGTTNPAQALEVDGQVVIGAGDDITPDGSGNGHLKIDGNAYSSFFTMDGTGTWIGNNSNNRAMILATDETARLTVGGTGNVGIGTTSPTYTLDVTGPEDAASRINITSGNTANRYLMRFSRNGTLLTNGIYADTSTASFGTPSDANLKTAVELLDTTEALSAIAALRAVSYRYLLDTDDVVRKGFIAQEVDEIIPEAVHRVGGGHPTTRLVPDENGDLVATDVDENGEPLIQEEPDWILTWEAITTTLVAAVQAQQEIITDLTARVEELEAA